MINDELKEWIIDYIDDIKKQFYYHNHEVELNRIRNKYIYKDVSKQELTEDHNRLCEIRKICECYTQILMDSHIKDQDLPMY